MSKKRSRNTENRSLRALIDQQLAAAAEEIFRLLKERGQAELERLKELVTERITAAVEEIFTALRATRAAEREPEEPRESPRPGPGAGRAGWCPDTGAEDTETMFCYVSQSFQPPPTVFISGILVRRALYSRNELMFVSVVFTGSEESKIKSKAGFYFCRKLKEIQSQI